jgi:hypothetical protein
MKSRAYTAPRVEKGCTKDVCVETRRPLGMDSNSELAPEQGFGIMYQLCQAGCSRMPQQAMTPVIEHSCVGFVFGRPESFDPIP